MLFLSLSLSPSLSLSLSSQFSRSDSLFLRALNILFPGLGVVPGLGVGVTTFRPLLSTGVPNWRNSILWERLTRCMKSSRLLLLLDKVFLPLGVPLVSSLFVVLSVFPLLLNFFTSLPIALDLLLPTLRGKRGKMRGKRRRNGSSFISKYLSLTSCALKGSSFPTHKKNKITQFYPHPLLLLLLPVTLKL